jgi:PTS system nitrogen regulatory IIA component
MELASLIRPELIFPGLSGADGRALLSELSRRMAEAGSVPDGDHLLSRLLEREELGSTAIGDGVAIPHCKLAGLPQPVLAVGTAEVPVPFEARDGQPVRLFFVLASPEEAPAVHLQALSCVSRWIKSHGDLEALVKERDPAAIYAALRASEGVPS